MFRAVAFSGLLVATLLATGCRDKGGSSGNSVAASDPVEALTDEDYLESLELVFEETALNEAKSYWIQDADKSAWLSGLDAMKDLRSVAGQYQSALDVGLKNYSLRRGIFLDRYKKDLSDWKASFNSRYPERAAINQEAGIVGKDRAKAQVIEVSEHLAEQATKIRESVAKYRERYLFERSMKFAEEVRRDVSNLDSLMKLRAKVTARKSQ